MEYRESFLGQKYGFLFQGMGVDYRGFVQRFDDVQKESLHEYCNQVQKTIQMNLWDYLFHSGIPGDDSLFQRWVAIYTTDCLIYDELRQLGLQPGLLMGYSMGLITALACGKAISFETGLELLRSTWEYLQYPRVQEEGMATIIGLTHQDIAGLIQQHQMGEAVEIASENNDHCIVISGLRESVARLMEIALNEGALKVKDLNSPYAIHSQYAILHIDKLIKDVAKATVKSCPIPLVSTLHQEVLEYGFDLKIELVQNMFTPMNWKATLVKAETLGICDFIEVSWDNSLTKVSKLVNPHYQFLNYDKVTKSNWFQTGQ